MSADLPLTDYRSLAAHTSDECGLELCEFCKCCCHGKSPASGCKVESAPSGMRCPDLDCGCEGRA